MHVTVTKHVMELEKVAPDGAEVWRCPCCPHRVYVTYTPGCCPVKTLVQGAKVQHIGAFGLSFEPAKVVVEAKGKTDGVIL